MTTETPATTPGQLKTSRSRRTPDGAMKTMKAVAEMAGVSEATVSRFLSGARPVHQETGKRIESAIHAVGYRKNRNAGALAGGRSWLIGLSIGILEIGHPATAGLMHSIVDTAGEAGYGVLIGNACNECVSVCPTIESFLERRVDGLLIVRLGLSTEAPSSVIQFSTPALVVDALPDPQDASAGDTWNVHAAGRQITQALLAQIDARLRPAVP
jgi:DNA-binding LacI/PurR family transcriptional regulator